MYFDAIGVILLATCVFCVITDLAKGKIYNSVTFPIILVGLGYHSLAVPGHGLVFTLLGILVGFLVFFPFFAFRAMGAGDVKMLMAIGALQGWEFVLGVAILSLLAGGVLSAALLLWHGRFFKTFKSIGKLMWSVMVPGLHAEVPKVEDCLMAPFALPILCGVLLTYFKVVDVVSMLWPF